MAPRRRTPFRSPAFEIGQKVYINVPADDIVARGFLRRKLVE